MQMADIGSKLAPSGEEFIKRAEAMIPMLRAKAAETEKTRRVSEETIKAFADAGFFKMLQPKRWGGFEVHPMIWYKVLIQVARACPSSAWNLMVLGTHQYEFGIMSQRAGDELWGRDPSLLVASSYAPFGKVKKVEGGYILNGEWPTSSGVDNARGGAFVGGKVFDENGECVEFNSFLVKASDYEILDDWFVMGLAGTGSKRLRLTNVFVPEYNAHSLAGYGEHNTGDSSFFKLPFMFVFFGAVSATITGMAQGMVDLYIDHMGTRENVFIAAGSAAANPHVKSKLGEAIAMIRSVQASIERNVDEAWAYVEKGELVPLADRLVHFATNQFAGEHCFNAAHMLFKKTATRGVWSASPIQRQMRDIMVAANHVTQNHDDLGELLGGFCLGQGLPASSPVN